MTLTRQEKASEFRKHGKFFALWFGTFWINHVSSYTKISIAKLNTASEIANGCITANNLRRARRLRKNLEGFAVNSLRVATARDRAARVPKR